MTGMVGPLWLAGIVGVLMLAATLYAITRIIGAARTRTATDYGIEICHAVMGVSMAGMLIPSLRIVTPGPSTWIWLVVQAVITAYFLFSVIRDLTTARPERAGHARRVHHLPHLVLSGAMVYMLAVMGATGGSGMSGGSMSGMSMGASGGSIVPWATLDLLLALFLIGYTVLLTDRLPFIAAIGGLGEPRVWGAAAADAAPRLYAPAGAAALAITMATGMSYALIMMFA